MKKIFKESEIQNVKPNTYFIIKINGHYLVKGEGTSRGFFTDINGAIIFNFYEAEWHLSNYKKIGVYHEIEKIDVYELYEELKNKPKP